jgi:hypothetical protein
MMGIHEYEKKFAERKAQIERETDISERSKKTYF